MFNIGYELMMHNECFAICVNFDIDNPIPYLSSE